MMQLKLFALSYLLNSLWQVPLLFATAWLIARALRSSGPLLEHRIWVAALLLQGLLPAWEPTWFGLGFGIRRGWAWLEALWPHDAVIPGRERVALNLSDGTVTGSLHLPDHLLSAIALAFAAVLAWFTAQFLWRARRLSTLRRRATPMHLAGDLAACWQCCSDSFGVNDAALATSGDIFGPITLGFRRRLVLLPVGMAATLSLEDLHTVLAHEFAHMRRHDFLKNLVYEAVTLPARFHPLLWLTRERVLETREMVCDRLASASAGERVYARSLLRLASLLLHGAPLRTPHAIGILDANTFERRLMRLIEKDTEIRGIRRLATAAACLVLGIATCCSALALHVGVGADSAKNSSKQTGNAAHVPGGVLAASILNQVYPVYPEAAKQSKIQGTVVLHAIIGKDGSVENLQVVSGPEELRHSALDAVRQWTYKPYILNGEPVEVDTNIQVTYSLAP